MALPHRASVDSQAPLSHRFSFRLQNSHHVNWATAGQTPTTLLHLEAEPYWVRLAYFNDQDTPWTVDGAALAVSAAVGDGHTPINAGGVADLSLWQRVTFFAFSDWLPLARRGRGFETIELIRLFYAISNREIRRQFLEMAKSLAEGRQEPRGTDGALVSWAFAHIAAIFSARFLTREPPFALPVASLLSRR
jgi:hypothetical protein